MIEAGVPDFVSSAWYAFVAPPNTPKQVQDKVNRAVVAILRDETIKQKLQPLLFEPAETSPWIPRSSSPVKRKCGEPLLRRPIFPCDNSWVDNLWRRLLSDEQKARFNDIGAKQSGRAGRAEPAANMPNPQAQCGANVMAWPTDQIDRVVHPNDAQRKKLEALQSAAAQAQDLIKAACPSETPATPPGRLAAVGKRLQAMLQAVRTVQPALANFYNALSDDQKARFNTMGRQLFAENRK